MKGVEPAPLDGSE
jgi:hypothetical protein